MLIEAPVVELDERRTTHAPALPEGVLEHHLNEHAQKQLAVQNLNKISFMVAPDGKRAISTEELKSDAHREIIEQSLKTLLGERIDNIPYLPAPESGLLGTTPAQGFVEINAPAHIEMLAKAGVKDFAKAVEHQHEKAEPVSHVARLKGEQAAETSPAKAA